MDDSPSQNFQFCLLSLIKINHTDFCSIIVSYQKKSIVLFKMNLLQNESHYNTYDNEIQIVFTSLEKIPIQIPI